MLLITCLQAASTDKWYKVLREVVLWMFVMDMGILRRDKTHPEIARILTNDNRYKNHSM